MILFLSNGRQIRGDLIDQAVLRSDLSPIPVTLEAEIRAGDGDFEARLQQGQILKTITGDEFYIIKSERTAARAAQGDKELAGYRVTALLNCCLSVAYVRSRAIIKENATLSAIYRAAGASIPSIQSDFPVPRFYCPIGQTPTFHIARVLQEEGGVVRWKNSRLQFIRLQSILDGKVVRTLPESACLDVETGFLERHEVPWFFSLDASGGFIFLTVTNRARCSSRLSKTCRGCATSRAASFTARPQRSSTTAIFAQVTLSRSRVAQSTPSSPRHTSLSPGQPREAKQRRFLGCGSGR